MSRKPSRKTLQKKLTKIVREYILLRDNFTCQWCGKKVSRQNAHLSHVIPKSQGNYLRWDENNLKTLCFNCHIGKWHHNPLEAIDWFESKFPKRWKYLQENQHKIAKFNNEWYLKKIEEYKLKIKKEKK